MDNNDTATYLQDQLHHMTSAATSGVCPTQPATVQDSRAINDAEGGFYHRMLSREDEDRQGIDQEVST